MTRTPYPDCDSLETQGKRSLVLQAEQVLIVKYVLPSIFGKTISEVSS